MTKNTETLIHKKNNIIRLSIQISSQQAELLNDYIEKEFLKTGILETTSAIIRKALASFLLAQ